IGVEILRQRMGRALLIRTVGVSEIDHRIFDMEQFAHAVNEQLEERGELHSAAQLLSEFGKGTARINFFAIETMVNKVLGAVAHGVKNECGGEDRGNGGQECAVSNPIIKGLVKNIGNDIVHQKEQSRNNRIDNRAIDNEVNVPQAIAQNGKGDAERNDELGEIKEDREDDAVDQTILARFEEDRKERGEQWQQRINKDSHYKAIDNPFRLLALHGG